jgi:hypothetical protein
LRYIAFHLVEEGATRQTSITCVHGLKICVRGTTAMVSHMTAEAGRSSQQEQCHNTVYHMLVGDFTGYRHRNLPGKAAEQALLFDFVSHVSSQPQESRGCIAACRTHHPRMRSLVRLGMSGCTGRRERAPPGRTRRGSAAVTCRESFVQLGTTCILHVQAWHF